MLPSAAETLGHRRLERDDGVPGVYMSPHMYTAIYDAEPQVLFQDGVYWRVLYQLAVREQQPLFHKRENGNLYVFPSDAIQITHVWVQPKANVESGDRVHISWNPLFECCLRPLKPRPDHVAAVTSGIFIAKPKRFLQLRGSVLRASSSASSAGSSTGRAQANGE